MSRERCSLEVGCDETGVCYAAKHGLSKACGRPESHPQAASPDLRTLAHDLGVFMNRYRATLPQEAMADSYALHNRLNEIAWTQAASSTQAANGVAQQAAFWRAFCEDAENGTFPRVLLDDAHNMGAGALELHYRDAIASSTMPASTGACEHCQGHGMIGYVTGQTPEQFEQHSIECPDCDGTGQIRLIASSTTPASPDTSIAGSGDAVADLDTTLRVADELLRWVQSIAKGENDTFLRLASTFDVDERYAMAEVLRHEAIDAISSLDPDGKGMGAETEAATRAPGVDDAMVESLRADICALDAWFRGEGPGYMEAESDALLDRLWTTHAALAAAQEGAQGERGAVDGN